MICLFIIDHIFIDHIFKSNNFADAEPQISASTSTLNDKGTEKVEEKQRHSILGLFTRKHQPPTSLENLPLKVL